MNATATHTLSVTRRTTPAGTTSVDVTCTCGRNVGTAMIPPSDDFLAVAAARKVMLLGDFVSGTDLTDAQIVAEVDGGRHHGYLAAYPSAR